MTAGPKPMDHDERNPIENLSDNKIEYADRKEYSGLEIAERLTEEYLEKLNDKSGGSIKNIGVENNIKNIENRMKNVENRNTENRKNIENILIKIIEEQDAFKIEKENKKHMNILSQNSSQGTVQKMSNVRVENHF